MCCPADRGAMVGMKTMMETMRMIKMLKSHNRV
jgi:hypothetical protein